MANSIKEKISLSPEQRIKKTKKLIVDLDKDKKDIEIKDDTLNCAGNVFKSPDLLVNGRILSMNHHKFSPIELKNLKSPL